MENVEMQSELGKKLRGKVKWFSKRTGYGFITVDGFDKEFFVHYTGIKSNDKIKYLEDGADVEIVVGQNEKGLMATEVEVVPTEDEAQRLIETLPKPEVKGEISE